MTEDEQIEAYLAGELAPPERQSFEDRLAIDEGLHQKVEIVRALFRAGGMKRRRRTVARRTAGFSLLVLLAAASTWWLVRWQSLENAQSELKTERVARFELIAGSLRPLENDLRNRFLLPSGTDAIELVLETAHASESYRITLRRASGSSALWSHQGRGPVSAVRVPVGVLAPGNLVLTIETRLPSSAAFERASSYVFSVERESILR